MARTPSFSTFLWRRLDTPGHDTCRLVRVSERGVYVGWRLIGVAVFRHQDGSPAQLAYNVLVDDDYHALHASIQGWIGSAEVSHDIAREGDTWIHNGVRALGLAHCVDLDLGFTPSTNLFQLRRLSLAEGRAADAPVAWIDLDCATLEELEQRYERRSETTYWYTAPRFDYAALLTVTREGFVAEYPGLWGAER